MAAGAPVDVAVTARAEIAASARASRFLRRYPVIRSTPHRPTRPASLPHLSAHVPTNASDAFRRPVIVRTKSAPSPGHTGTSAGFGSERHRPKGSPPCTRPSLKPCSLGTHRWEPCRSSPIPVVPLKAWFRRPWCSRRGRQRKRIPRGGSTGRRCRWTRARAGRVHLLDSAYGCAFSTGFSTDTAIGHSGWYDRNVTTDLYNIGHGWGLW